MGRLRSEQHFWKKETLSHEYHDSLLAQLEKLARHNRQGSFRTKERYYEAVKRFCWFLAEEFHLRKLANVNAKHLTAYIEKLQIDGKSASTVKTDLAAIRFFHDKLDRAKYQLPSNEELSVELERRRFGRVDRTWSIREFNLFLATCITDGQEDYAAIACLSYYAGLRIHECFCLDAAAAEQTLQADAITVKGKGGKVRTVPINESIRIELQKLLDYTPRGHKLFVPDGQPTHLAITAEETSIGELQQAILEKMAKNGPITARMRQDVMENVYHNSLINWIRSFR